MYIPKKQKKNKFLTVIAYCIQQNPMPVWTQQSKTGKKTNKNYVKNRTPINK